MNYEEFRRNYTQGGLHRNMLSDCPLDQFDRWQQQALESDLPDPTAASLATTEVGGYLWQRIVLLKSISDGGFVFFTNYDSNKGQALAASPSASLLFPWLELERQVTVSGTVERISEQASDDYFSSRPRESQIGAWTSAQSQPIDSRDALMARYTAATEQFADAPVPRPPQWGGYRLRPTRVEFWQGGEHRLHDRFVYTLNGSHWEIERLQP